MSFDKTVYCAISAREWEDFGCPGCGNEGSFSEYQESGVDIRQCSDCEAYYVVLSEGYWQTPFPVKFSDGRFMPMNIQAHPFKVSL